MFDIIDARCNHDVHCGSVFVVYVIMRHSSLMKKKVTVLKHDVIVL